jgi:putative membrane protein
MHMTLLGALFALANRPLFTHVDGAAALADQHLGGAIMLTVGGASYLIGGLWLCARMLRVREAALS